MNVSTMRAIDSPQSAVGDRQTAAHQYRTFEHAIVEFFLVIVTFVVAVKQPRHRCIAPIDDRQAIAIVQERALADEHGSRSRANAALQTQVAKIWIGWIHRD